MAAGRYFRLVVPIFAICLIIDLLMRWHLVPSADQRPFPLNLTLPFEPSLLHVASFSFFDVFVNYSQRISYNPPLWTMSFELIGSYIVFGLLTIRMRRLRWIVSGIFLVFSLATVSLYALFVAGICIAEAYASNFHRSRLAQASCAVFLVVAAIWAMFLPPAPPGFTTSYLACVILLCVALIGLNPTRRFFETRVSRFLGRISFPLYLVQAPIIYCFSLRAIAALEGLGLSVEASRLIAGVATIPVCIVAALAFAPVDKASVWIARSVGRWFSRQWGGLVSVSPLGPTPSVPPRAASISIRAELPRPSSETTTTP
jgi:peptidoglycan/LPS O-acetylase OafA/YrhL